MDTRELNKVVASVLATLLVLQVARIVGDALVEPHPLEAPVYALGVAPAAKPGAKEAATEAAPKPLAALLATASEEDGKQAAKKCVACHSFDKGGPSKVGPNLFGVVGANKAHISGFNYSSALSGKGGTWTYDELSAFLAGPREFAPGTRMSFAGLKKAEERAAIIKYLRSLSDQPLPLPGS
ncbi:MAG: cytochrome c family protein [Proteobacteria bacterium]|nr:cytochrome c family protein [Pseudomonadota bacterium]